MLTNVASLKQFAAYFKQYIGKCLKLYLTFTSLNSALTKLSSYLNEKCKFKSVISKYRVILLLTFLLSIFT